MQSRGCARFGGQPLLHLSFDPSNRAPTEIDSAGKTSVIIATTAQQYDLAIASRDTSDFEKALVTVFNPWVEAALPETE